MYTIDAGFKANARVGAKVKNVSLYTSTSNGERARMPLTKLRTPRFRLASSTTDAKRDEDAYCQCAANAVSTPATTAWCVTSSPVAANCGICGGRIFPMTTSALGAAANASDKNVVPDRGHPNMI